LNTNTFEDILLLRLVVTKFSYAREIRLDYGRWFVILTTWAYHFLIQNYEVSCNHFCGLGLRMLPLESIFVYIIDLGQIDVSTTFSFTEMALILEF
jgi:hypothetical protein